MPHKEFYASNVKVTFIAISDLGFAYRSESCVGYAGYSNLYI